MLLLKIENNFLIIIQVYSQRFDFSLFFFFL